jgi:hypothetical protein
MTDLTEHDAACLTGWPAIEWRKPMTVRIMNGDGSSRLCCRLCIVRLGLRPRELESCPYAFRNKEAFGRHLKRDTRPGAINIATALTPGDMTVL